MDEFYTDSYLAGSGRDGLAFALQETYHPLWDELMKRYRAGERAGTVFKQLFHQVFIRDFPIYLSDKSPRESALKKLEIIFTLNRGEEESCGFSQMTEYIHNANDAELKAVRAHLDDMIHSLATQRGEPISFNRLLR